MKLLWCFFIHSTLPVLAQLGHTPTSINARGDSGLDEWLAANNRAPPSALTVCPLACQESGNSSTGPGWFLFPEAAKLAACNETMVLDFITQNKKSVIRACTADYSSSMKAVYEADDQTAALCPTPNHALVEASIKISHTTPTMMMAFLFKIYSFGYSKSVVIGVFGGAEVHQHGVTIDVLNGLLKYAEENSISKTTVIQLCEVDGRGADYGIGIIVGSAKKMPLIQEAVKNWADGRCVPGGDGDEVLMTVTLRVPSSVKSKSNGNETITFPTGAAHIGSRPRLIARAECKTTTVEAGDGCWAVANWCKISQDDLVKYNTRSKFCETLVIGEKVCCSSGTLPDTIPPGNSDGTCKTIKVVSGDGCSSLASKCGLSLPDFTKVNAADLCTSPKVGQHVCCSRGKLPDLRPKPNPDGSCATYTTITSDSCSTIAASLGITITDIENFNKKTWGWTSCKLLWVGFKLCVSSGVPPMPASVANAICGPTVPGTKVPPKGTDLATLNPCPLKVCCNIWGQCGTTDEFCTISKSETGAPGTSAPGISNCGKDIIKGPAPSKKINVAYFEAWNKNRKCLTMDVDQIDTKKYTHIHFAFIDVTSDFNVDVSKVKEQFGLFKGMSGIKKIISFSGWDFSTLPSTFHILREAVKPGNRDTFQKNIIAFMNEHKLDGVDLDWEYPGAPDIPGIPAGDPKAGMDYYEFLSGLKSKVDSSKTVSFAAPASYHYLKSFPMEQMGAKLDYIVYMTYDLHGQWDYSNPWTSPGCPEGNCLRSHVNETETKDALSMITKAGVPSNKVVVGVTSYGRSFKMAQAGCTAPTCKFTGTSRESNAAKGRCTDTGGYISNAEIDEIITNGKVTKQWKEEGSNILVYNDTEWVAYMDDDMKAVRSKFYDSYNFAGTTDWAVDLQEFLDGSGGDDYPDDYEYKINHDFYSACSKTYTTFKQLEDDKGSIPAHCMEIYIIDVEIAVMEASLKKYKGLINDGYDGKFKTYERYIREQVPGQIDAFMKEKSDLYFKCTERKDVVCCSDCTNAYCGIDCDISKDCKDGVHNVDVKCQESAMGKHNVTFSLRDSKGFYKDIGDKYGIEESWINIDRKQSLISDGCKYAGKDVLDCLDRQSNWFWYYPVRGNVKVFNPKDVIGDSYPKTEELLDRIKIVRHNTEHSDLVQLSDVLDAASLPALTLETAVASMEKISETAKDIEKKEREEMIISFITGFLFFVPIAGQAAGAAGLTAVRSILRLLGTAGDAGLLLHDIITHPESAFLSVFGALAGAGVGRGGFKKAANSRRSLKSSELDALGPVKKNLDMIENLRGAICKL
ncbi:glycosyl hydrolase, family 18 [Arthroderma uncinatum]|uniref:glycosyl hydrolase, family 18 n=1 Tax=Arthroderma uncinatum TaxID=74035 RepID=UPI00144AC7B6|nr:glycosyl hydrolase, family 18 [Arthroderma uncinatum]KAF3484076.1 glycosyl hydrolase, family 18 [Arthroderma uncinatum]